MRSLSSGSRRAYLIQTNKMKAKKGYDKVNIEKELSHAKADNKHKIILIDCSSDWNKN